MKSLEKIYRWVLVAPAFLPLFFIQGMMYPLMAPKTLALRALGLIALALFSYLSLSGRAFYCERLRSKVTWLPGALLAVAYVSSFFGADFYRSFWSTFERGDGLLTLTVCVGYFYLFLLSADRKLLSRLLTISAWVGSFAAVYLIIQWLETFGFFDLPLIVLPNGRVGGTMGNAAFAAAYLGMTFFLTLAAARSPEGQTFREGLTFRRTLLYAGAALELFAILLTATRGTILALAVVGIAWLAYRAFGPAPAGTPADVRLGRAARSASAGVSASKGRSRAQIVLAALIIVGGFAFAFRTQLAEAPFEPVRRLASISLADSTVSSRLFLWQNLTIEAIKQPVLGFGAEHVGIPFNRVFDPTAIQEEWFDRSHNAYLDYLLQFGFLGGLLYFSLVGTFLFLARRQFQEGEPLAPWLLALVGVYALQNIFVFDTGVTLWLFLALLAGLFVQGTARASVFSTPKPVMGAITAGIFLLLLWPVAIQPFRANLLAFEAYLYQIVDVPRSGAAAEKARALGTYADLELGYNAYFMYTEEQLNQLSGPDLERAYDTASGILTGNFTKFPYDARIAVYLAQVLVAAPGGVKDPSLFANVVSRAIEKSPKRSQSWYLLANISIGDANRYPIGSQGRMEGYEAAKDVLKKYIQLVPGLSEPHFVLAQLELASGAKEAAAQEAELGKSLYIGNLYAARRAAQYYESVLDLPNAAFFLREILRHEPNNQNAAADLAQIEAYGKGER